MSNCTGNDFHPNSLAYITYNSSATLDREAAMALESRAEVGP